MSYAITLKTPFGEMSATADSWEGLFKFIPVTFRRPSETESQAVDNDVLNLFYSEFKKRHIKYPACPSVIEKGGYEIDLIRLFLDGSTIRDVITWMKNNKGIELSRSAVGRYWVRFRKMAFENRKRNLGIE